MEMACDKKLLGRNEWAQRRQQKKKDSIKRGSRKEVRECQEVDVKKREHKGS